jgi:tetratricopeptide (TPR) repeat protein
MSRPLALLAQHAPRDTRSPKRAAPGDPLYSSTVSERIPLFVIPPSRWPKSLGLACLIPACLFLAASLSAQAVPSASPAQTPTSAPSASSDQPAGRMVLVLPFDNRSGDQTLNWVGDSFPDTLNQRLNSAGFLTITRDDRQFALDHLGLPIDFRPTRATTIQIAQTLNANFVIVGSYSVDNGRIAVQAQVLEINKLRMSAPLQDSSELARLFDIENAIAWKVAKQIDPRFPVAEQTFLSASGGVGLTAFEDYIRGTDAANSLERIQRLEAAVAAAPAYSAALLALGKAQFTARQYDQAAATLARVPHTDRLALEASFYKGLSWFNTAKYAEAESAFAFVVSRLPLPEVVNNQAVAASRQGKDAVPLFERVTTADPNDADYHYNLAVALLHRGDAPAALRELNLALKLRPSDAEAITLHGRVNAALDLTGTPLTNSITAGGFDPLERIRRSYSEASFRQAAFQLDEMRAMRLATLPPAEQAAQYTQLGRDYLGQGLIPEAEREFQAALAADAKSAAARAGLAQVREQSGSDAEARSEAHASLELEPSVDAYLVLARLDLKKNDLAASASEVASALKIEANNGAAQGMKQALLARGQSVP